MTHVRVHLTFPADLIGEPVIYRLGREFDLVTNIRRANIKDRGGWMILEMQGSEDVVTRAVVWLADQGIQVDRIMDEDRPGERPELRPEDPPVDRSEP